MRRQHVFIIGCKGIPARYGGFETFVDQLTAHRESRDICYHVACAVEPEEYDRSKARFTYQEADCVTFPWKRLGAARAVTYDMDAMRYFIHYAKRKDLRHPIFYLLACRIGPMMAYYRRRIEAIGGELYVNPDGHEFLRAKWNGAIRKYWKLSERLTVKHAHLLICDSRNIELYIQKEYGEYKPETTYIAYGADTTASKLADDAPVLLDWYRRNGLKPGEYYLVVGRFVPENNFETMLREFCSCDTDKKLVLITEVNEKFLNALKDRTNLEGDERICFVGTVYDKELLKKIRENAYGYLHGHEVGGTNPSLLEALGSTRLNLLLDVGFNREVAEEGALYWRKDPGDLAKLIAQADEMSETERDQLGQKAKERIRSAYSWEYITKQYEEQFLFGRM